MANSQHTALPKEAAKTDPETETYTFTLDGSLKAPLLYCCNVPKPVPMDMVESAKVLEGMDLEHLAQANSKKKKLEEDAKFSLTAPRLRLDAVRAAIKVALKCKMESGYELIQGFAGNVRALTYDMGVLNTIRYIFPKLAFLLDREDEDIQMKVLEQVPDICGLVMGTKGGYEAVVTIVLPKVQAMIHSISKKISDKAVEVVLKIAQRLTDDDRGKYILTDVLKLAHDEEDDDARILAVQLLSKLAEIFGTELCEQFVTHEIMSLAEDPSFKVRKAAAEHLVEICRVVAPATFVQKMFPLYCTLAGDSIWGVRKAAADNIVEMSKLVGLEIRITTLTQIILTLLQDISQWVQKAALQRLGEFIATLIPSIIPTSLIDSYASMAVAKSEDEEEVVYQCAFNFPAVIYACGKEMWEKLRKIYMAMWNIDMDKVSLTLSSSIHEVAKILGKEVTATELLPLMLENLQDGGMTTSLPLLRSAGEWLGFAGEESKEEFAEIIQTLHEDSGHKWRIREAIAVHIYDYAKNYTPANVLKKIWGTAMLLCTDDVWKVRTSAANNIWKILDYCAKEEFIGLMKTDILTFSGDTKWASRQVFIMICDSMPNCEGAFLDSLLGLAKDPVAGVRLAAAKAIKKRLHKLEESKAQSLIKELSADKSLRIREVFAPAAEKGKAGEETKGSVAELVSEEAASKMDIQYILKEIEAEGNEKVVKKPLGMKIDEVDA